MRLRELFFAPWAWLFPHIPACVGCGVEKGAAGELCPRCAQKLHGDAGPVRVGDALAYAAYRYDGLAADIVRRCKYHDGKWLCAFMARALVRVIAEAGLRPDMICYVPLHKKRRAQRGFDQAEEIARHVAHITGRPMAHALRRVRHTPSQTKIDPGRRLENVRGAFEKAADAAGCALLVDDVLTTGATAAECAGVLKDAGAQSVVVLAFARAGAGHSPG